LQDTASRQLPGSNPQLLGIAPSVWVLLPSSPRMPLPAGLILLHVYVSHSASRTPGAGPHQQARPQAAAAAPQELRLLAYCPQQGGLLRWKDRVAADEGVLYQHPRFLVPAWDSG
jgi:hypothetical protein